MSIPRLNPRWNSPESIEAFFGLKNLKAFLGVPKEDFGLSLYDIHEKSDGRPNRSGTYSFNVFQAGIFENREMPVDEANSSTMYIRPGLFKSRARASASCARGDSFTK